MADKHSMRASVSASFVQKVGASEGLTLEEVAEDNMMPSAKYTAHYGPCQKVDDETKVKLDYLDSQVWKTRYLRLYPSVLADMRNDVGTVALGGERRVRETVKFSVNGSEAQNLPPGIVQAVVVSHFLMDRNGNSLDHKAIKIVVDPLGRDTSVHFNTECYGTIVLDTERLFRVVVVNAPSNNFDGAIFVAALHSGQIATANVAYSPLTTTVACNDPEEPSDTGGDPDIEDPIGDGPSRGGNPSDPPKNTGCTYDENGCVLAGSDCEDRDTCNQEPDAPREPELTPCQRFADNGFLVVAPQTVKVGANVAWSVSVWNYDMEGRTYTIDGSYTVTFTPSTGPTREIASGAFSIDTLQKKYINTRAPNEEGNLRIEARACGGTMTGSAFLSVTDEKCFDSSGEEIPCNPEGCTDAEGNPVECPTDEGVIWTEQRRSVENVDIDGVTIARISRVTFKPSVPDSSGKMVNMTLVFNNPN